MSTPPPTPSPTSARTRLSEPEDRSDYAQTAPRDPDGRLIGKATLALRKDVRSPSAFMARFEEFRADSWTGWRDVLARLVPKVREFYAIAGRGSGKSASSGFPQVCGRRIFDLRKR